MYKKKEVSRWIPQRKV